MIRSAVEESLVAETTVLKKVVSSTASSIASDMGIPIRDSLLFITDEARQPRIHRHDFSGRIEYAKKSR